MVKLVVKLDEHIYCCLLKDNQLLTAFDVPSDNITVILEKVGDFKVDEVCVYAKPDTRQGVDGVRIDSIVSDHIQLDLNISQNDYDTMKAIALKTQADVLSFYDAYKHYLVIMPDAVVVDTYIGHSFVVAHLVDGTYKSLEICSTDRLQQTIEACQNPIVVAAHKGTMPELGNIDKLSTDYTDALYFLQWVLQQKPCYSVEIDSGAVFEYGDKPKEDPYYRFTPDEFAIAVTEIQKNLPRKTKVVVPKFSLKSTMLLVISVLASFTLGVGVYSTMRMESNHRVLDLMTSEKEEQIQRLHIEEEFFQDALVTEGKNNFTSRLDQLQLYAANVALMSVRFQGSLIELTIFTTDEPTLLAFLSSIATSYTVESNVFEKDVIIEGAVNSLQQYNVILSPFTGNS